MIQTAVDLEFLYVHNYNLLLVLLQMTEKKAVVQLHISGRESAVST